MAPLQAKRNHKTRSAYLKRSESACSNHNTVVNISYDKVLSMSRIPETHLEDEEACSKYGSEVLVKWAKAERKQIWWMITGKKERRVSD